MTTPAHALFAELAHIPKKVTNDAARRVPKHIDLGDLRAAADLALFETIQRHGAKTVDDIARLAWVRCAGAIQDELRRGLAMRGTRRGNERPVMTRLDVDLLQESSTDREPAVILPRVRLAIDSLPPRYRRVVLEHARGKMTTEQAREMGVSEARVSQIHARALEMIRERLGSPG